MPGKVDESKWNKAKAAAKKQYPDWDEDNPRFWKVVSAIYKKMGGEFSKQMEKSLGDIEAVERITPSFIENPRIWIQALKKSVGGLKWDVEHLGLIMRSYAALGGRLIKSGMPDFTPLEAATSKSITDQFQKAQAGSFRSVHKYAERVEKPGGGYKYIYRKDEGKRGGVMRAEGSGAGYRKIPKKPGQLGVVPEGQAAAHTSMAAIVDNLNKQSAAAQRASLQNVSDDKLTEILSHAKSGSGLKKVISEEKAARKVKDAKKKAEAKEKPVQKSQQDDFTAFSEANYAEVKSTLQKSHPEWDDATLVERTGAQLRQIYKLRG